MCLALLAAAGKGRGNGKRGGYNNKCKNQQTCKYRKYKVPSSRPTRKNAIKNAKKQAKLQAKADFEKEYRGLDKEQTKISLRHLLLATTFFAAFPNDQLTISGPSVATGGVQAHLPVLPMLTQSPKHQIALARVQPKAVHAMQIALLEPQNDLPQPKTTTAVAGSGVWNVIVGAGRKVQNYVAKKMGCEVTQKGQCVGNNGSEDSATKPHTSCWSVGDDEQKCYEQQGHFECRWRQEITDCKIREKLVALRSKLTKMYKDFGGEAVVEANWGQVNFSADFLQTMFKKLKITNPVLREVIRATVATLGRKAEEAKQAAMAIVREIEAISIPDIADILNGKMNPKLAQVFTNFLTSYMNGQEQAVKRFFDMIQRVRSGDLDLEEMGQYLINFVYDLLLQFDD